MYPLDHYDPLQTAPLFNCNKESLNNRKKFRSSFKFKLTSSILQIF